MNDEHPTFEEMKKAKMLEAYLADLENGRASRIPFDMRHDAEFLKELAEARDFALLHAESEPRSGFVKALEQKFIRRGVKEEDRMRPRGRPLRRILPFSLAAASFAVIVLAVIAIGGSTPKQTPALSGAVAVNSTPKAQKSAVLRTTGKIAENIESLKENIVGILPEPAPPPAADETTPPSGEGVEPPASSPEVKIASLPSQVLDDLDRVDDDFLFPDADLESGVFGDDVALANFVNDAVSIEF